MEFMYNEEEYIYSEFVKNFISFKKEPIVLYGISERTGNLLKHIMDFNVIGLMDGKRRSGIIWDKPILNEQQVVDEKVHTIIIIARSAVLGMIYHRIEKFVQKNHINVYDIHGVDLSDKFRNQECDIPYYHMNWEVMRQACAKYDIVTFDVFDTLLVRKTLFPRDIFGLVERQMRFCETPIKDFQKMRINAEYQWYKRGVNPTIVQIYEELGRLCDVKKTIAHKYMETELETEFMSIAPRMSMRNFFNEVRKDKPVYLISDMYLSSVFIQKILTKCGYEGYSDLLVSCEYGCSKRNGLFECIQKKFSGGKKILHIGDDEVADDVCAREAGLGSFHIMNGRELLANSSYNALLEQVDGLFDHLMIGLLCYKAFDDPFVFYEKKGKLAVYDQRLVAYLFCAPVFTAFCIWMMQKIRKENCEFIIYPARDAYVLEKICEIIKKKQQVDDFPDGKYLYTSRRSLNAATIFSRSDIERIARHEYYGGVPQLFWERFHINIGEDSKNKELSQLIDKYEKDILESCQRERENYLYYIYGEVGRIFKKIASIDFIAAGSVQSGLCKLMPEKEVIGFYFQKKTTAHKEMKEDMLTYSFYEPCGEFEMNANIYQFYLFLELVLTSPEPTFYSMSTSNAPVFMKEVRNQSQIDLIMDMQDAILEYVDDISELYPDLMCENISTTLPDQILGFLGKEYSEITNEEILNMILTDEYMSKRFNIFDKL